MSKHLYCSTDTRVPEYLLKKVRKQVYINLVENMITKGIFYLKAALIMFVLILLCFVAYSCMRQDPVSAQEIDLSIIAKIESNNNPLAYNPTSHARGLYQITPICLEDYNITHKGSEIALISLYEPVSAHRVAEWYISRIKIILAKKGISAQTSPILISYNWGVGNYIKWVKAGQNDKRLPLETRNYIKKYYKLARLYAK